MLESDFLFCLTDANDKKQIKSDARTLAEDVSPTDTKYVEHLDTETGFKLSRVGY